MGIDFRRPLNPFGIRFGEVLVWTKTGSTPPPEPTYTVTISLTNPHSPEYFDGGIVYQINSTHLDEYGFYDDLTEIGSIDNPVGEYTVQVS